MAKLQYERCKLKLLSHNLLQTEKSQIKTRRNFQTCNATNGRTFLLDETTQKRVKEETEANPFPVRFLKFTTSCELYKKLSKSNKTKPSMTIEFNAAYIDTNPKAEKSTPIIVCIHGCPGGHWDFNHLTVHLAKKGYRIIIPNFPGYGWTKIDKNRVFRHSAEEKANFMKDFLSCLGIDKVRMGIIHSAGVYPGLVLTGEEMNVFESVAFLNPLGLTYHRSLSPYFLLQFYCRHYRNPILRPFLLVLLKMFLLGIGFGNTNTVEMSVALESMVFVPYEEFKKYPKSIARRQLPTVLIHSLKDRVAEPKLTMELAFLLAGNEKHKRFLYDANGQLTKLEETNSIIKHMENHIFSSGGHFLMKKYPNIVNEIIEKFLNSV